MRSAAAGVFLVLAGLLVAATVPVAWAHSMVTDSDRFVDATRSLSADPGVQATVAAITAQQLSDKLDVTQVGPLFPPALRRLAGTAQQALDRVIRATATDYVRSEAFTDVWPVMVRSAHDGLVTSLTGPPGRPVVVDVAPVIVQVRDQLAAVGVPLVDRLTIGPVRVPVARVDTLTSMRGYVRWLDPASVLMPVAGAFCLLLGVALSRHRRRAFAYAALSAAAGIGLIFLGLRLGEPHAVSNIIPSLLPIGSRHAVYDALVADLRTWLYIALAACGVIVAVVVILAALSRARRLAA